MLSQNVLSGFSPDLFVNSLNGKPEAYVFHNKFPAHKSVYVQHHVPLPQLRETQYTHIHTAMEQEKIYLLVFPCRNNAVSQT